MATARHLGFSVDDVRGMVGGSIKALSRRQASTIIEDLGGGPLPHPPGEAPRPKVRPAPAGVTRMITPENIEQIARLLLEAFDSMEAAYAWLFKNWSNNGVEVKHIRDLATAERAGHVIYVLKEMIARRQTSDGKVLRRIASIS